MIRPEYQRAAKLFGDAHASLELTGIDAPRRFRGAFDECARAVKEIPPSAVSPQTAELLAVIKATIALEANESWDDLYKRLTPRELTTFSRAVKELATAFKIAYRSQSGEA